MWINVNNKKTMKRLIDFFRKINIGIGFISAIVAFCSAILCICTFGAAEHTKTFVVSVIVLSISVPMCLIGSNDRDHYN